MVVKGCWIMETGPVILTVALRRPQVQRLLDRERHGVPRCRTSLIHRVVYFAAGGDALLQKCVWIFGSPDTSAAASLFGPLATVPEGLRPPRPRSQGPFPFFLTPRPPPLGASIEPPAEAAGTCQPFLLCSASLFWLPPRCPLIRGNLPEPPVSSISPWSPLLLPSPVPLPELSEINYFHFHCLIALLKYVMMWCLLCSPPRLSKLWSCRECVCVCACAHARGVRAREVQEDVCWGAGEQGQFPRSPTEPPSQGGIFAGKGDELSPTSWRGGGWN